MRSRKVILRTVAYILFVAISFTAVLQPSYATQNYLRPPAAGNIPIPIDVRVDEPVPNETDRPVAARADMGDYEEIRFSITPAKGSTPQEQLINCLSRIRAVLKSQGLNSDSIVMATVFVNSSSNREFREREATLQGYMEAFYGSAMPPASFIGEIPADNKEVAIQVIAFAPKRGRKLSIIHKALMGVNYVVVKTEGFKSVYAAGLTGRNDNIGIKRQSEEAFVIMDAILKKERMSYSDIIYQHNYVEDIIGKEGEKEKYQIFCGVRKNYYKYHRFKNGLPAATGIDGKRGGVVIEFVASKVRGRDITFRGIPNREQIIAHRYGQGVLVGRPIKGQKKRATPKFEREKVIVRNAEGIIEAKVSGTAAIKGEITLYKEESEAPAWVCIDNIAKSLGGLKGLKKRGIDGRRKKLADGKYHIVVYADSATEAQTWVTIDNIAVCVSEINLKEQGIDGAGRLKDFIQIRTYIKYPEYVDKVRDICSKAFGNIPSLYLICDVCRKDLFVEIEATAVFKGRVTGRKKSGKGPQETEFIKEEAAATAAKAETAKAKAADISYPVKVKLERFTRINLDGADAPLFESRGEEVWLPDETGKKIYWEKNGVLHPTALTLENEPNKIYLLYRAIGSDGVSRIGLAIVTIDGAGNITGVERFSHPVMDIDAEGIDVKGCEDPRITIVEVEEGGRRVKKVVVGYTAVSEAGLELVLGKLKFFIWGQSKEGMERKILEIVDRTRKGLGTGELFAQGALAIMDLDDFLRNIKDGVDGLEWKWKKLLIFPGEYDKDIVLFQVPEGDGSFFIEDRPNYFDGGIVSAQTARHFIRLCHSDNLEGPYRPTDFRIEPRGKYWLGRGTPPVYLRKGPLVISLDHKATPKPKKIHLGYRVYEGLIRVTNRNNPEEVLYASDIPVMYPQRWWEIGGADQAWKNGKLDGGDLDLVFPTGLILLDEQWDEDGVGHVKLLVFYGARDQYCGAGIMELTIYDTRDAKAEEARRQEVAKLKARLSGRLIPPDLEDKVEKNKASTLIEIWDALGDLDGIDDEANEILLQRILDISHRAGDEIYPLDVSHYYNKITALARYRDMVKMPDIIKRIGLPSIIKDVDKSDEVILRPDHDKDQLDILNPGAIGMSMRIGSWQTTRVRKTGGKTTKRKVWKNKTRDLAVLMPRIFMKNRVDRNNANDYSVLGLDVFNGEGRHIASLPCILDPQKNLFDSSGKLVFQSDRRQYGAEDVRLVRIKDKDGDYLYAHFTLVDMVARGRHPDGTPESDPEMWRKWRFYTAAARIKISDLERVIREQVKKNNGRKDYEEFELTEFKWEYLPDAALFKEWPDKALAEEKGVEIGEIRTKNGLLTEMRTADGRYLGLTRPTIPSDDPSGFARGDVYWVVSEGTSPKGPFKILRKAWGPRNKPDEDALAFDGDYVGTTAPPFAKEVAAEDAEEPYYINIYHGISKSPDGNVYRLSIIAHDKDGNILYRSWIPLIAPDNPYEMAGWVENVDYSNGNIPDLENDAVTVYYGTADTYIAYALSRFIEGWHKLTKGQLAAMERAERARMKYIQDELEALSKGHIELSAPAPANPDDQRQFLKFISAAA